MEFMDHRRAFYRDPYWKFYRTGVIRLEKKKKKKKKQNRSKQCKAAYNSVNSNRPDITKLSYLDFALSHFLFFKFCST